MGDVFVDEIDKDAQLSILTDPFLICGFTAGFTTAVHFRPWLIQSAGTRQGRKQERADHERTDDHLPSLQERDQAH